MKLRPYLIALFICILGFSPDFISAQTLASEMPVYNETTGEGFSTLNDALKEVPTDDGTPTSTTYVIIVNENTQLTTGLNINSKKIKLIGKSSDVVVKASDIGTYYIWNHGKGDLNIENIVLDGNSDENRVYKKGGTTSGCPFDFEAGANFKIKLENVVIQNFRVEEADALICVGDWVDFECNNVTFKNIINNSILGSDFLFKITEKRNGDNVASKKYTFTLGGKFNSSLSIINERADKRISKINCSNLDPTSTIKIFGSNFQFGEAYFTGMTDTSIFKFEDKSISVQPSGDDLIIVKDENYQEPTAVKIEGGNTYNTLSEAVSEANEGDVILVNESHALSDKLTIDKRLTIRGNGDNITITNPTTNGAYLIQNEIIFDNIALSGGSASGNTYISVESEKGNLILKDVSISGYTCGQSANLIKTFNGGKIRIENLDASGVNITEGKATVAITSDGSAINGNNKVSLLLEKAIEISKAFPEEGDNNAQLSNDTPIRLYIKEQMAEAILVSNATEDDINRFTLVSDDYVLSYKDGNIILSEKAIEPTKVLMNGKGYDSLEDALNDARDGDIIRITEDMEISTTLALDKVVTITGVKQSGSDKNPVIKLGNNCEIIVDSKVTISNLNIDADGNTGSGLLKVKGIAGELSLEDVMITGYTPVDNAPVISTSDGGIVLIKNLITDKDVIPSILIGNDGSKLEGDNVISLRLNGKSYLSLSNALTNTVKIKLIPDEHGDGDIVVKNATESDVDKFDIVSDDYILRYQAGSIVLEKRGGDTPDDPDPKPSKITIEGKDKGYDSLEDAIEDAESGDILSINSNLEVGSMLNIDKDITIIGKAYDSATEKIKLQLPMGAGFSVGSKLIIKGLEIDGVGTQGNGLFKVSGENAELSLENISISNYIPTGVNSSVIIVSDGGKIHLDNTDTGNIEDNPTVRIFNNGSTLKGNVNAIIFLADKVSVSKNGELTNSSSIVIITDKHENGDILIKGCGESDLNKFELESDEFKLKVKDGNIILVKVNESPEIKKIIIFGKDKEYDRLEEAIADSEAGDRIIINGEIEIESSIIIDKDISIESEDNSSNSPILRFAEGKNLNVKTGILAIKGVKIYGDIPEGYDACILNVVGDGKIDISNVTVEDKKASGGIATIRISGAGSTLSGDNIVSILLEDKSSLAIKNELKNESPIHLFIDKHEPEDIIISGCSESDLSRFKLINDEFKLEYKDGNLILAKIETETPVDPEIHKIVISGKDGGFDTLSEAIMSAEDGDIIEIRTVVDIENEIVINKSLTFIAVLNDDFKDSPLLQFSKKGSFKITNECKIKSLNINGGGMSGTGIIRAIGENAVLMLDDVEFSNYTATGTPSTVINITGEAKGVLKDVRMGQNINLPNGAASVWISGTGSSISGCNDISLFLVGKTTVAKDGTLSNDSPVKIYIDAQEEGDIVISGCVESDLRRFQLVSDDYTLIFNDSNIIITKINDVPPVELERVAIAGKDKIYATLEEAVKEAESGDVLEILEDIELASSLEIDKDITIIGTNIKTRSAEKIRINTTTSADPAILINGKVSLENLVLDGENKQGCNMIGFTGVNNDLTLKDMEFHNYIYGASGDTKKLIHVAEGNKLHLNNVTADNVSGPEGMGMIDIHESGCTMNGNNKVTIHLNRSLTLSVAKDGNLTHTEPIEIFTSSHEHGSPVILNCEDPILFKVKGWNLVAENGNLILRDLQSEIESLSSDDNLPVEFFNLNGIQVKKENLVPGIYIRKQGKKTTKVIVR